jgi:predicted restriction endonuclease
MPLPASLQHSAFQLLAETGARTPAWEVRARSCRITGVTNPIHLRASHCKPWRDSNNDERLNGENGLLLTPTMDHLFDRGFISFEDSGVLIVSPVAHVPSLNRMGTWQRTEE